MASLTVAPIFMFKKLYRDRSLSNNEFFEHGFTYNNCKNTSFRGGPTHKYSRANLKQRRTVNLFVNLPTRNYDRTKMYVKRRCAKYERREFKCYYSRRYFVLTRWLGNLLYRQGPASQQYTVVLLYTYFCKV